MAACRGNQGDTRILRNTELARQTQPSTGAIGRETALLASLISVPDQGFRWRIKVSLQHKSQMTAPIGRCSARYSTGARTIACSLFASSDAESLPRYASNLAGHHQWIGGLPRLFILST